MSNPHSAARVTLILVVGVLALAYIVSNIRVSGSTPIMPLDDTYIHFQYARVLAEGHPLRYNPDQPPTSGATSFLYPVILAVGYWLTDKRLEWWSLAIGGVCWLVSAWLVYRIAARDDSVVSRRIALIVAVAFALSGPLDWAFMSGMETGLMIVATLLTLWYVIREDWRGTLIAGTFAALVRPEGLAVGLLAAVYMLVCASPLPLLRNLRLPGGRGRGIGGKQRLPWLALLLIAGALQPLINLLATGTVTASGLQAKSILYNVPPRGITQAILNTALRIWTELITGISPFDGVYFVFILSWLALIALLLGLWRSWQTRRPTPELLIFAWLLAFTGFVSVLETAFWQFKRYQQPMIALLFPLAAWTLFELWKRSRPVVVVLLVVLVGGTLLTSVNFLQNYIDNVREVASSQVPMARYVAANVPAGEIIGVHDIGVMRYLGNHDTYDVIGLTTPNAARAWRNGLGSVYEQMRDSPWRPDYFAIYADARGLNYLAATDLYKSKLADFPSTQPPHNVASATGGGQAVYKSDWSLAQDSQQPHQPSSLTAIRGMALVDTVNVADLASEDAHQYRWWEAAPSPGFASEVYEMNYIACPPTRSCRVIDGGRLITGGEEMTIKTTPGQDLLWITRVHPRNAATVGVFVNGKRAATRVIPAVPGQWLEIATLVPGCEITSRQTVVRVEANINDPNAGQYMPYFHWFYQGKYIPPSDMGILLPRYDAAFGQSILLLGRDLTYNPGTRTVKVALEWQAKTPGSSDLGDAKLFVHVLGPDGQIVAQTDQRPGQGTLPPANWLPGILDDEYNVVIPANVLPGSYRVAIGLYDPAQPDQRLPVTGDNSDPARRLFIGSIHIP